MQHVVDLNAGDGGPLQRGHQNAAQRVAQRQTEAALKRFGDNSGLSCRLIARFHIKLCRLDEFCPILMDHASLHSCLPSMSQKASARGLKCVRGPCENTRPLR